MSHVESMNESDKTKNDTNDFKRRIQRKLESWNRPTPSREFLQVRLDGAGLRRETAIMEKVTKAAKYGNDARKRAHVLSTQKLKESTILQEKLEAKQASANEKKQKLLRECSERSLKKDKDIDDNTLKVLTIEKKVQSKQNLVAQNKDKIVHDMTEKVRTKMNKVSSLRAQHSAEVDALQGKLEEKHANASAKKENLLKAASEKSLIQKTRYTQSSMNKLKAIENKSNQKQMKAATNKENLTRNVSIKVQEKMEKVSNLQTQKVAVIDALRDKLEEKQSLASTKKEDILKEVSEKPLLQKEKYAEASQQKLMALKDKIETRQNTAAEKKEHMVKSVTLKLQEKKKKISSVQAQKIEAVEALQDKLFERHAHASTKKENMLESISQKPKEQKERYASAAIQKVNELEEKITQKQILATEKKKKIDECKVLQSQEKMEKVSSIQARKAESVELLQDKIKGKHMKASRKKLVMSRSMSERSLGSLSRCSTFSVQELHEQKVKAIEEKVEKKHNAAAENKENLIQSISMKMKEKITKVMNAQMQKIDAVNALKVKFEEKQALASVNKDNVSKASSAKIFAKKERMAMSAVSSVKAIEKISYKNDVKMKAAVEQKSTIIAGIVEKSAEANQKKLFRSRDLEVERKQKVETLEANHKAKLITAAQKKKNILSEICTNVSSNSSNRVEELAAKKARIENELRLKHEGKLKSAQKRRELMLELEKEKREVIRNRRENIRKMKMISRQNKALGKNIPLETTLETIPLEDLNVDPIQNSRNVEMESYTNFTQGDRGNDVRHNLTFSDDTENTENSIGDGLEFSAESAELEARRNAFKTQAAEEIRSANEVKRAELMKLAEERKKAMLRKGKEGDDLKSEYCLSIETSSTATTDSCDWEDTISYSTSDDQSRSSRSLSNVELEPGTRSADIRKLESAAEDLALAIEACDVKLSDIQLMQSLILAQEAASEGKDEFKTVENLDELDSIEMSFSRRKRRKLRLASRIEAVSKRVPIITARIADVSKRAKPVLASRVTKLSRHTRGGLQSLRSAANKLDERRRQAVAQPRNVEVQ